MSTASISYVFTLLTNHSMNRPEIVPLIPCYAVLYGATSNPLLGLGQTTQQPQQQPPPCHERPPDIPVGETKRRAEIFCRPSRSRGQETTGASSIGPYAVRDCYGLQQREDHRYHRRHQLLLPNQQVVTTPHQPWPPSVAWLHHSFET